MLCDQHGGFFIVVPGTLAAAFCVHLILVGFSIKRKARIHFIHKQIQSPALKGYFCACVFVPTNEFHMLPG